jgi:nucleoside-diphosphate-sugar epimerase
VAKALDGVDAVVHCAAVVAIETRRAHEVRDTNLRSVELVVGGAVDRGVGAIVYVSSLGALFAPGAPLGEHSPIAVAHSPYARSKADGEAYVRRLQDAGAPIRTVYPPGIIGPDDPALSEGNHTIRAFLTQLMVDTRPDSDRGRARPRRADRGAGSPERRPGSLCRIGVLPPVGRGDRADGRAHRSPRAAGAASAARCCACSAASATS